MIYILALKQLVNYERKVHRGLCMRQVWPLVNVLHEIKGIGETESTQFLPLRIVCCIDWFISQYQWFSSYGIYTNLESSVNKKAIVSLLELVGYFSCQMKIRSNQSALQGDLISNGSKIPKMMTVSLDTQLSTNENVAWESQIWYGWCELHNC